MASSRPVRRAFGRVDLDSWRSRGSKRCRRSAAEKEASLTRRTAESDRGSKRIRSEVALQKKDTGEVLRQCLAKLSPDHREIIDLVYYHEKSVEEVAEIVDIPENTVKTRMFYARKKLAELLKQAGVERGWL